MRPAFPLAIFTLGACLAGCVEVSDTATSMTMAPTEADMATPAYQACRAAIARETGKSISDIAVFDYVFSEAGTQIQASVAGAEAPWSCLSSNSGVVANVTYTGSEGAL